jgi:hypothetical protein
VVWRALSLYYNHERGARLYESASWNFVPEEELHLLDFGGDEELHWSALITESGSDEIDYDG